MKGRIGLIDQFVMITGIILFIQYVLGVPIMPTLTLSSGNSTGTSSGNQTLFSLGVQTPPTALELCQQRYPSTVSTAPSIIAENTTNCLGKDGGIIGQVGS